MHTLCFIIALWSSFAACRSAEESSNATRPPNGQPTDDASSAVEGDPIATLTSPPPSPPSTSCWPKASSPIEAPKNAYLTTADDENGLGTSPAGPLAQQYTTQPTQEDKDAAVNCHNKFRSELAMGKVFNKQDGQNMSKAANMRTFEWDDNLAKFAEEWANNCTLSHSWNGWAGENLAMNGGTFTNKDGFEYACGRWWNEILLYGFNSNLTLTEENFHDTGHWCQMAWADTDRIGCAMAQNCPNTNWKTYVVCWYYPGGNYFGAPVYLAGEPCSKCNENDTCDEANEGLCSQ